MTAAGEDTAIGRHSEDPPPPPPLLQTFLLLEFSAGEELLLAASSSTDLLGSVVRGLHREGRSSCRSRMATISMQGGSLLFSLGGTQGRSGHQVRVISPLTNSGGCKGGCFLTSTTLGIHMTHKPSFEKATFLHTRS